MVAENTKKGTPPRRELTTNAHVEQLANTSELVHDEGIIHRDVCVSNIFSG